MYHEASNLMGACRFCGSAAADGQSYCGKCGKSLASADTPTITQLPDSSPRPSTSSNMDEGRFPPGTLLAQRYRVVSVLGRGGMGEVYRANDLLVGQPVALKFLPREMAADDMMLARFRNEVRVARQVSHPNVCRVHDLGEADGQPFLSMEYVDGEDLGSLLQRIGRLPPDKAIEIARQLCAGLAAAHDQGVLHRDLKPANIMLDGRGRVRITDFGLAAITGAASDVRSGTPAYMAPEQREGRDVTARSDIYALGVVLHEVYTGAKPGADTTKADLDPTVDRVIQRCLNPEPAQRPANALAVAAALPGGDPLAAALAAGETPTPEMVAASGSSQALAPWMALVLAGVILSGLIAAAWIDGRILLQENVPFDMHTQALAQKARETMARLGHTAKPGDTAFGFAVDRDYRVHAGNKHGAKAMDILARQRPSVFYFWYRTSPTALAPLNLRNIQVRENDPPVAETSMVRLYLDPEGRLTGWLAVPSATGAAQEAPWPLLFELAALDMRRFTPVEPRDLPAVTSDSRMAWKGTYAEDNPEPVTVEAAAFRGRPVYFALKGEWSKPAGSPPAGRAASTWLALILNVGALVLAAWMAAANIRKGRSDFPGAARLAVFLAAISLAAQLAGAHYGSARGFFDGLFVWLPVSVFVGALFGTMYLALEPHVRRRWPQMLVSWTRLLAGGWRDPLVGRHLLYGIAAGVVFFGIGGLATLTRASIQVSGMTGNLTALLGVRMEISMLASTVPNSIANATFSVFLLFAMRIILRNQWAAAAAMTVLFSAASALNAPNPWVALAVYLVLNALVMGSFLRFGFFATLVLLWVDTLLTNFPPSLQWSRWYAGVQALPLLSLAVLSVHAFRTATKGQRMFPGEAV